MASYTRYGVFSHLSAGDLYVVEAKNFHTRAAAERKKADLDKHTDRELTVFPYERGMEGLCASQITGGTLDGSTARANAAEETHSMAPVHEDCICCPGGKHKVERG